VDPIRDLIQRLRETQGDTRTQSVVTAEFLVTARPKAEQEPFRATLDAAAVLHWFDAELLEKVLEVPRDEAESRFETLKAHSFVERYRGEKDERYNLHESTRLGWRAKLSRESPDRFRLLSDRASSCFANSTAPSDRIEWIYHLLCGNPDLGALKLEELDRQWLISARPEDRYALTAALQELTNMKLLSGRARARCALAIGWTRAMRGETALLADVAAEALMLARSSGDASAEANAMCLEGDVRLAQGKLAQAQAAFDENLAINRRLVEQDPSNSGWHQDLAVAHSRVADLLEAQGKLPAAQAALDECLVITRRLAEQDLSNTDWQRELAATLGRIGDIRQAEGKLPAARAAYDETLTIIGRLAEQDPSNPRWQRELAVAHSQDGDVLQAQGQLAAAQEAFDQNLTISRRLAEQDPSNAGWQRELAVAHGKVGTVLWARGNPAEAIAAFGENLAITRRLTEHDESNAGWQRDFALACFQLAKIAELANVKELALTQYQESLRIFAALVERAPDFVQWSKDKKVVEAELATFRKKIGVAVSE
jgi:tetratricopeptide (TPR) repeat protein